LLCTCVAASSSVYVVVVSSSYSSPQSTLPFFSSFYAPAPPDIYTLSLHDALPIFGFRDRLEADPAAQQESDEPRAFDDLGPEDGSEEHTSELQSPDHVARRLLPEKKEQIFEAHHSLGLSAWGRDDVDTDDRYEEHT